MTAIDGHMKANTAILSGRVHHEDLGTQTASLADLAKKLPNIFPEGSDVGKSEALPEIWEDPEGFADAVSRFIEASDALHQTVENEGDFRRAVMNVGRTCDSCHDDFRE